tara:strand:+ start:162 stop:317 length:156 start_codon:yes stop_codon:yes gene_type:complete
MAVAANNKRTYWMAFLISTAICIGFLFLWSAWFWVFLPAVLTSLVLAMDKL